MKHKKYSKQSPAGNTSDRTTKVIIMAGAGASAPLGYSTLIDFESAIAKYAPKTTAKEKRELAYLFQLIRRSLVSKGEYTDFEAILWRFSDYLDLCSNLRLDQFLENEFLSTTSDRFRYSAFAQRIGQGQNIVDKIILEHYGQQSVDQEVKQRIFEVLKSLLDLNDKNEGFLDYFTTNYDIGIETVWSGKHEEIPIITGVENSIEISGEWRSSLLDINQENRKGLYVHRLHGCVCWYRPISETDSDRYKMIASLQPLNDREWEPCVMFPGRKFKTSQPPFVDSFIRLRDDLFRTACCVIIGTSFRDNNIMEYLLDANERRDSPMPLVIVNTGNIKPRFFQRIREVRKNSHFHYNRKDWQIKFIIGNYINKKTQEDMLDAIKNPGSIDIIKEDETKY